LSIYQQIILYKKFKNTEKKWNGIITKLKNQINPKESAIVTLLDAKVAKMKKRPFVGIAQINKLSKHFFKKRKSKNIFTKLYNKFIKVK
jgi:hypothetical protein